MPISLKKAQFIVLAITALIFSRLAFAMVSDAEGPNLLVVAILAAVIYVLSLVIYLFKRSGPFGWKQFLFALVVQLFVAAAFVIVLSPASRTISHDGFAPEISTSEKAHESQQ